MTPAGQQRRLLWGAVGMLVVCAALLALLLPTATPQGPTSVSRQAEGLRAAWRYLEVRGWPVSVWRRPLTDLPLAEGGVLVLAVPAAAPYGRTDLDMVRRWLMVGGDVVLLLDTVQGAGQTGWSLLEGLDVSLQASWEGVSGDLQGALAGEAVLHPGLEADWVAEGPVLARTGRWHVRPEPDDVILALDEQGEVFVRERAVERGRLLLIEDRALLSNAWFARPGTGNPALVEHLLGRLDSAAGVYLEEWHWGLREVIDPALLAEGRRGLDALLLHLLLIYLGVVWALGRRFGPGRPPPPPPRTSVDRDLLALGALHARAGHADELGQLLLDAVRRTASGSAVAAAGLPERFDGDAADFLALAQTIGALQREGRL